MAEPFLGEIRIFAFTFPPAGWAFCEGQLLSISQNTALFSILGTTYGGNGIQTFALPNLQGSAALGFGSSPTGIYYTQGQTGGETSVTLNVQEMPAHNHLMPASATAARITTPGNTVGLGAIGRGGEPAYSSTLNTTMSLAGTSAAGGGQPHNNLMPYLTLNFCIALQGIFPSRN